MSPRKKIFIVVGIFIGLFLIITLITLSVSHSKKSSSSSSTTGSSTSTYTDSASGTTVSDPSGKAPEDTSGYDGIIYLGFSKFVDYGISNDGLTTIQVAAETYYQSTKIDSQTVKQVSVAVDTIVQSSDDDTGLNQMKANLIINNKITNHMIISYDAAGDTSVDITDFGGKLVYSTAGND